MILLFLVLSMFSTNIDAQEKDLSCEELQGQFEIP